LLFLGFLATAFISAALLKPTTDRVRLPQASSYSTAPQGCKALYVVLEELQLPVSRFRKPFQFLGQQHGALIVVDARKIPFTARELAKLEAWVKSGNRFVFFQGSLSRVTGKESGKPGREPAATRPRFAARHALERKFGLSVKTFPDSSRSTLHVSSRQLDEIAELDVSKQARWASAPQGWTIPVGDEAGPVVLAKAMGKGEIIAVSDPTLVQNRFIDRAQNVRLVPALLLGKGRPAAILFDEYHHGYRVSDSLWEYFGSSVFAWIMVQGVVFAALFFYSERAGRTGTYRSLSRRVGRSSLEHIDAMAGVFASCRAGSVALEAVMRRFLTKLAKKTGVPVKSLEQAGLDDRLFGKAVAKKVSDLVNDCNEAIRANDDSNRVVQLARRLAEVQLHSNALSSK